MNLEEKAKTAKTTGNELLMKLKLAKQSLDIMLDEQLKIDEVNLRDAIAQGLDSQV